MTTQLVHRKDETKTTVNQIIANLSFMRYHINLEDISSNIGGVRPYFQGGAGHRKGGASLKIQVGASLKIQGGAH
jgi:hypothetical protein